MPTDSPNAVSSLVLLLAVCCLLLAATATAGETKHVLVLYSSHRLLPANSKLRAAARDDCEFGGAECEFLDYPASKVNLTFTP